MSNNDLTAKHQKLVKARKAARFVGAMVVFGGVVLLLYGIFTSYFPTVLNGAVFATSSILPFTASKLIEKKLDKLPV